MRERTISTQAIDQIGQVRFRDLLCGHNSERAAYNQVLLETRECIVAPTLGSIVPNWLLIVPRCPVVSFRKWQAITRMDPVWLIGEILAELEIEAERTIWFEHGPSAEGRVRCRPCSPPRHCRCTILLRAVRRVGRRECARRLALELLAGSV